MSHFRFILLFSLALAFLGETATPARADDSAPHYAFHGVIVEAFPEKGMLMVKYEEVPGLMKASTLAFHVDETVFPLAKKRRAITATLVIRNDDFWLENVQVVKR